MDTIDTAVGQDPVSSLDERLLFVEEQLENLIRRESAEQPAVQTSPSNDAQSQPQALPALAPPAPPRRSTIKRLIRPVLGVGLLGLSIWALTPLLFDVRSTQAVVNAPVVAFRSPIDGTVKFLCETASGANVSANTPLFSVRNALADDDRLDSLKDEQTLLEARIEGFRQQDAGLSNLRESLLDNVRKYDEARLRTLELECEKARAGVEAARVVEKQRTAEEEQINRLQSSHIVSTQDTAAVHFAAEAAHHGVVQARKSVENLEEQIRALRAGVHVGLGDGGSDLPYSAQRLHELSFRAEEVHAAFRQDEAKLAQLKQHLRAEEKSLALRSRFTAAAPADCVVWRRYVASNTAIKADSPLLDLIDPAEIFIDAVIYEKDLTRVRPGDTARVRLAGSDKEWTALVRQVVGRTLPWPDRLLAVEAVLPAKQEIHVILSFSKPLSTGEGGMALPIGIPAEVTFISMRDLFGKKPAPDGT